MLRAALKSLLGRKVRLLMSTFAIVLGAAFVVGTLAFSDTLSRSFAAIFASSVGDVVVEPEGAAEVQGFGGDTDITLTAELVEQLAGVDGAARADGNVEEQGVFPIAEDGKVIGGQGAPGLGVNWSDAPPGNGIEGLQIIDGRPPEKAGEVAMDEVAAEKAGYEVGDTVGFSTSGAEPSIEATLVGTVGYRDGGSLAGASIAAFDTATAQELFTAPGEFDNIWVTAEDGVSQEELRDNVADELPEGVDALTGDDAADEAATQLLEAISFLRTFLLIFAGVSLIVGGFLIVNTFSILVAQRGRELALLRALGASRRQVTRSVLVESFVVGVVGGTLGMGLGYVLALGIRALFATFGLDLSGYDLVIRPTTWLACYGVAIVVTMIAAWLPARKAARIAPIEALRDDVALPETSIRHRLLGGVVLCLLGAVSLGLGLFTDVPKGGWLVGAGVFGLLMGVTAASAWLSRPYLLAMRALYQRLFGQVGNLAGQNSLRNPRRTTATASALMIGLALAGTMSIVGASAKATVDKAVDENFVGDYIVSSTFAQSFSPSIARQMAKVDGVDEVVRLRAQQVEIERGSVSFVTATDRNALTGLLDLSVVDGSLDGFSGLSVVVDEGYAEDEDLAVGDTITAYFGDKEFPLEVVAIYAENPLAGQVLMTVDAFTEMGYADKDSFLVVDADPGSRADLEEIVADSPLVSVLDQREFAQQQREPIDQMVLLIFALLGLALIIAVLGIVNTLALSVIERTREIGLLRAIGVSRGQMRRMVVLESILISLLGAILGVLMGIGFGLALMQSLKDEGLDVIAVPWGQLAIYLVAAVVVGVLAAVLPALRAARLDVLKAIATE